MTTQPDGITLQSDALAVTLSPQGAELQSVQGRDGAQWLWHGAPAFWSGRAPLLFPVVGKSPSDELTIAGKPHPMLGHGFARTSCFELVEQAADRCRLRLGASDASRTRYPFEFELVMTYALRGATLTIHADIANLADTGTMPASFGFHPAFVWPLPGCRASESHVVRLAQAGEPPVRRLDAASGLLLPGVQPSPFHRGTLVLRTALFEPGALIVEEGAGSLLHYGVPGKPGIAVAQEGLPMLGLWTKPGAPFLCIEPWHGLPPDIGASAALEERPGIMQLAPGATRRVTMSVTFGAVVPETQPAPLAALEALP
ncbi:MAG TPA: aldose 1-epimerase family protein [Burkholderiaceae bacterium]|nr:aldose 1-epimerase family protein [Burkholderiaceae bacterium]